MENKIEIPTLNWFESNPWAKVGNKYTGSTGASGINNNAFLFRINYYRKEDGNFLVAEVYDSISQLDKSITDYTSKTFDGSEDGRNELIDWLEFRYSEFCNEGKDKLKIHYYCVKQKSWRKK